MLVPSPYQQTPVLLVAAQVIRPGLRDYLQGELNKLQTDATQQTDIVIYDDTTIASAVAVQDKLAILAGSKLLLASNDPQLLQSLAARQAKGAGNTAFAATAFGQAISASY